MARSDRGSRAAGMGWFRWVAEGAKGKKSTVSRRVRQANSVPAGSPASRSARVSVRRLVGVVTAGPRQVVTIEHTDGTAAHIVLVTLDHLVGLARESVRARVTQDSEADADDPALVTVVAEKHPARCMTAPERRPREERGVRECASDETAGLALRAAAAQAVLQLVEDSHGGSKGDSKGIRAVRPSFS